MKLTQKLDYSIRILLYIADSYDNYFVNALTIATGASIPYKFSQTILRKLLECNILNVKHGAKGGYQLQRSLKSISFLEIIELIDGKISIMDCLENPEICSFNQNCNIKLLLKKGQAAMLAEFAKVNLDQLLVSNMTAFPILIPISKNR